MSTFAIDGLVSGLDTKTVVNQLMQIEQAPQRRLQVQVSTQTSVITAYQSLATRLKAVDTAANALTGDAAWLARSATVVGTTVAATAGPQAATGDVTVAVTRLAAAAALTTDSAYGLDVDVFTDFPIVVTKADGSTVSLTPASGTMRDVLSTVNSAADTGVRAVAVRVGTDQYRLQIVSAETGTEQAPRSITGMGVPTTTVAAVDAAYTINGIEATSTSNTVSDAISGVTVSLLAIGTSTIRVSQDAGKIADKMQALVTAINDALGEIGTQTVRDAAAKRGPLASDSSVRNLTGSLLRAVSDAVGTASSAALGLQTDRFGKVSFDRDTFLVAYDRDPRAARDIIAPTTGSGVAQRLSTVAERATNATTGTFTLAIQGREITKRDLQTQVDGYDNRLDLRRKSLERQFSQLEVSLSRLRSQSSYLGGQLGQLNRPA